MSNIINSEKEIKHKEPYYIRCVKCGNYIKVRMFPEDMERIQNGDDTPIQEILLLQKENCLYPDFAMNAGIGYFLKIYKKVCKKFFYFKNYS